MKRSGLGKTVVMPSNRARDLSAFDRSDCISSSYQIAGKGGSGFGINALYPAGCVTGAARTHHIHQVHRQVRMRMQNAIDNIFTRGHVFGSHTSHFQCGS